jgi:hypothetical protein
MAILGAMIPLPKPRGFWDYALLALFMTGLLMLLFWGKRVMQLVGLTLLYHLLQLC